jgi:retron-type reverse transcriptase
VEALNLMGVFNWLRKLFGKQAAPQPATPAGDPAELLRQLQGLVQTLGVTGWYYQRNNQNVGPFTIVQLQQLLAAGQLQPTDVVWREGMTAGVPLSSVLPAGTPLTPGRPVSLEQIGQQLGIPAVRVREIQSDVQGRMAASQTPSQPASKTARPRTLNLDAADFLPIARADLKEQAQKIERWGPWFGRRDLIPPAEDPRTKLIDRGLVSNGLLSPEQLVEIHAVGAEMERVRPTLESIDQKAYRSGEEAVQAERAQKAKLKAQKKAEAEQRKKDRAEAIAQRKASDIIFLGRGVSGRLNDRQSNAERLGALGLPVLSTPADLAGVLGVRIPRLRWLAFHTQVATRIHYVQFTVPKKSGGLRTLSAPHKALAGAQRWILENILSKLPCDAAAHGFLAGKSILSNAQQHVGKSVVVNVDLEDFFPSIAFPRVRSVFQRAGYSGAVATILALLCTECPRRTVQYQGKSYHVATGPRGLPQGACTSPALSNQVARRLDRRLTGLATKLGLAYTRYADDLTFSGPLPIVRANEHAAEPSGATGAVKDGTGYLLARIRHIAEAERFHINQKKSRVLRRGTAQLVTGLVVNDKPSVRRKEIRRLRAILHRARREGLEAQNRERRPDFRAWLEGKIAYIRMVRPEIAVKLTEALRKLASKDLSSQAE